MHLLPYAKLLMKIANKEEFLQDDWVEVIELACLLARFLYDHSDVKLAPISQQIHIQPKHKVRRKRSP